MNNFQNSSKVAILDGLCKLYKRPNSEYWWAIFHHKREQIRSSTKETDLEKAKAVAREWYYTKRSDLEKGIGLTAKTKTFAAEADRTLATYEDNVTRGTKSQAYVTQLRTRFAKLKGMPIGSVDIASVNQQTWNNVQAELLKGNPTMSDQTLHQYKNAIQVTLKHAYSSGHISAMPTFVKDRNSSTHETPRTWFNADEYKALKKALQANISKQVSAGNVTSITAAEELYDYVLFIANTGLRVGEAKNVRFCDVTVRAVEGNGKSILEIRNIKGKRGSAGLCKSFYHAVAPFKRCIARRGLTTENYKVSELTVFEGYHKNMFKEVLQTAGLHVTNDRPPRKRDLMSLRHTYICMRLLKGVPVFDIAINCRTSTLQIHKHYARHLNVLESDTINKTGWKS